MAELDVVQQLLMNNLFIPLHDEHGRKAVLLKETDVGAKLRKVKVLDLDPDTVVIELDKADQPATLFKEGKGQRKRCDFVLLTKVKGQKIALFVEMKSESLNNGRIKKQFRGAECLMDYCDAVLNRFYDQENLLEGYIKRFVLFYKNSINKTRTRPVKPTKNNDTPENMFKYANPINPSINHLVVL